MHDQRDEATPRPVGAEDGASEQETRSDGDGALMAEMPNGALSAPRHDEEAAPANDLPEPWEPAGLVDRGAVQHDSAESADADGDAPGRGGEAPDVYEERLRKDRLAVDRMMARLYRRSENDPAEACHLIDHILQSSALKHVSAHATQVRRVGKKKKNLNIAKVRAIQESMDLFRPCDEPARLFFLRKPSGGERPIVAFGDLEHALQEAVQRVLVVNTSRWNTQFDSVADALDFIAVTVSTWR